MCFASSSKKWSLPCAGTVYCYGQALERVSEYKYLGVLTSSSVGLSIELDNQRRKLLRKGYAVLHKFRLCDGATLSYLLSSFCFGLYGCEVWDLKTKNCNVQWKRLRVGYHDIIKKAAKVTRMTSNHVACAALNVFTFDKLVVSRQCTFFLSLLKCKNPLVITWVVEDDYILKNVQKLFISIGCNTPSITASRIKLILSMIDFLYI